MYCNCAMICTIVYYKILYTVYCRIKVNSDRRSEPVEVTFVKELWRPEMRINMVRSMVKMDDRPGTQAFRLSKNPQVLNFKEGV